MGPSERAKKIASYFKKTGAFRVEGPVHARAGAFDSRERYIVDLYFIPAGAEWEEHYEIDVLVPLPGGSRSPGGNTRVRGEHAGMVREIRDAATAIG